MLRRTSSNLKGLIACSILYMVLSLVAAVVAVAIDRPARFAGLSDGLTVVQDFLYGLGTAMSPPLYYLLIQVILTVLAPRHDRWGGVAVSGLALFGLISFVGALGEPILFEIFDLATFDVFKALIYAGMILVPFAMLIFGILEWLGRRRDADASR